jgi:hypothetical protein
MTGAVQVCDGGGVGEGEGEGVGLGVGPPGVIWVPSFEVEKIVTQYQSY